jgi:hypothetical protein
LSIALKIFCPKFCACPKNTIILYTDTTTATTTTTIPTAQQHQNEGEGCNIITTYTTTTIDTAEAIDEAIEAATVDVDIKSETEKLYEEACSIISGSGIHMFVFLSNCMGYHHGVL